MNVADQNRPINAPTWTVSGNATYTWDIWSGSMLARTGYDWRSFTKVANTTPSVTDQPAYGLLNAGVAFTTTNKAWRFSIDGKNLTDRYYRVAGYDFGARRIGCQLLLGGVSQIGFYGPPRTYHRDGDLPLLMADRRRRRRMRSERHPEERLCRGSKHPSRCCRI